MPTGDIPSWDLADRIIKARRVAGLSQQQLSTLTGVSDRMIKRYEAGTHAPRAATIIAIAWVCRVDAEWLNGAPLDETPVTEAVTHGYLDVALPIAA